MQEFQKFTDAERLIAEVIGENAVSELRSGCLNSDKQIEANDTNPVRDLTDRAIADGMYLTRLSWLRFSENEHTEVVQLVTDVLESARALSSPSLANFSMPGPERAELDDFLAATIKDFSRNTLEPVTLFQQSRLGSNDNSRLQAFDISPRLSEGNAFFFYDALLPESRRHYMHVVLDDTASYCCARVSGEQMVNALLAWVENQDPATATDVIAAVHTFTTQCRKGEPLATRFAAGTDVKLALQIVDDPQIAAWYRYFGVPVSEEAAYMTSFSRE